MRPVFRLATFLFAILFLLLYFGVASLGVLGTAPTTLVGATSTGACTSTVQLIASDPYDWSAYTFPDLCYNVNFTVVNQGTNQHTFTVSNEVNQTATSVAFFSPGTLYYNEPLNSGATLTVEIHFNTTGYYDFTCIPHYSVGMHGVFYVEEAAQGGAAAAPNFEPFWYIVAVVGTLATLAVVGGLVYGKAGAESTALDEGGPITSHPEYYNDSRPDPLDSAEPMKRGGGKH